MHPQTKIVGETVDGLIRAIVVDENGALLGGGAPGGVSGDASAANQISQTERLVEIRDRLQSMTGDATATNQTTQINRLIEIRDRLPASGTNQGVSVNNLPATQPISATVLPLPNGAAKESEQAAQRAILEAVRDRLLAMSSGDASAANQEVEITNLQEINSEIGNKTDVLANPTQLQGDANTAATNYTIFSLLKGLLWNLNKLFGTIFNIKDAPLTGFFDNSGTIVTANQATILFSGISNGGGCYLLIQNLIIPGSPNNNLWVNLIGGANIGVGSIQIKSGELLELKGSMVNATIQIIGEEVGQKYTAKLGVN